MPKAVPTTGRAAAQRASSPSSKTGQSATPALIEETARHLADLIAQCLPVVVACEACLESVLAAVGLTYLAHASEGQVRLASASNLQPRLGEQVMRMPPSTTDDVALFARRVLEGLVARSCAPRSTGGRSDFEGRPLSSRASCVHRLVLAAASDDPDMPQVIYRYARLAFATGPRAHTLLTDPRVAAFNDLARFVSSECEHTRQFVRFSHMSDGSYLATFSPKANTLALVATHFAQRMGTERFCIVDPCHRVAVFHEPGERVCQVIRLDQRLADELAHRGDLADDEPYVRALWRRFFRGTTTPGRDASKRGYDLQLKWMPKRLRSCLVELGPEEPVDHIPSRYGGKAMLADGEAETDSPRHGGYSPIVSPG